MNRARATPEERTACVDEAVELMGEGMRMYRAADVVSARSGWARNTIIEWLRADAPGEVTMLRGAEVPRRVTELEEENAELRDLVRRLQHGEH